MRCKQQTNASKAQQTRSGQPWCLCSKNCLNCLELDWSLLSFFHSCGIFCKFILGHKKWFLFLRHFFEKKNECEGGQFFFIVSDYFSCFPVDSNVKHCVISYTLPLITEIFSRTARWNSVLMFYNITRSVTIAFNALRNAVVWSNLRKLYYNIV